MSAQKQKKSSAAEKNKALRSDVGILERAMKEHASLINTAHHARDIDFKPLPYPQTPQSARRWFVRHGINRSQWAAYFGLERTTVEHLLGGRYRGRRGAAHEAAVKLGLKEHPND